MPIMSISVPAFILGMHAIHGVLGSFQLPPFLQTLSKERPNGQGDRMFTLPSSVINVEDFKRFTPRKQHLKPKKLLKRLGNEFDPFWMSADLPDDFLETYVKQTVDTSLGEQFSAINLTALEQTLQAKFGSGDGGYNLVGAGSGTSNILDAVKSWLVHSASCPVYYLWEDLGLLYWPRWVRRGLCSMKDTPLFKRTSQSASKIPKFASCSWPPGMHCVPGNTKRLKILRWQCRHNKALNNFNRFRLPGVITPKSDEDSQNILPSNNNQHLMEHLLNNHNVTHHHFRQERVDTKDRQDRGRRDTSGISSDQKVNKSVGVHSDHNNGDREGHALHNSQSNFLHTGAPRDTQQTEEGKKRGEGKEKKHSGSKGQKQEADHNDTENWNSISWKQRRKDLDLKCKWIKIPYPVTDNCFCSC